MRHALDQDLLANPYWAALLTGQAHLAIGGALARRFPARTIPFAGVAQNTPEALEALCRLLAPGDEIFLTSDTPLTHLQLTQTLEMPGLQMVHPMGAALPSTDPVVPIEPLGEAAIPEMIALKAVAFPGYFGPRAARLGSFYGVREPGTGALVAMCGERLMLPGLRELSALCTHPAHTGKGYAAALLLHLLQKHRGEGLRSFLHVVADNARAIALYHRLGFMDTRTLTWHRLKRM